MKLQANWLSVSATQDVCRMLTRRSKQALFVGGCVRNTLLQAPVSDIDIATDALPQDVMDWAGEDGLKAIPTGIDHGTVTLVAKGIPHEITTFRRDVATDGRRATVAFSSDVAEDAARRDFTMNALYADPEGTIIDPLNGLPDLQARYVRFIGSATDRIQEDYLRTLRYFRFHAWYGDPATGFDPDALDAIANNLSGLSQLSHERIGAEFIKLLSAPDPAPSIATMRTTGALAQFLPGSDDRMLAPLVHVETLQGLTPDPMRRLAILGGDTPTEQFRLSRSQARVWSILRDEMGSAKGAGALGYHHGLEIAQSVLVLRAAILEQPVDPSDFAKAQIGAQAKFPLRAADLMPTYSGAALGRRMTMLTTLWIASDFKMTKQELLAQPND